MNLADEILNDIRNIGGRMEASGDLLHIDVPAGTLSPELKARLKQHKAEILKKLEAEASMHRLVSAGICIAVFETGEMRVVVSESQTVEAIDGGATIYSPQDMLMYVRLSERERRLLHHFKKRFGGITEWTQHPSIGTGE